MCRKFALLFLLSLISFPSSAFARCGGLCLWEIGAPDNGAAGVGSAARANDASTVFWNPAGMTRLEGTQQMIGTSFIYVDPQISLDDSTVSSPPGSTDGGTHSGGFIPAGGMHTSHQIDDDWWIGFGSGGAVGGGVDYGDDWVGRTFVTKAELSILSAGPAVAYRVNDYLSFGAQALAAYTQFDMRFRASDAPDAPNIRISDADDWAVTGTLSALISPSEGTRVGLYYRAPTDIDVSGDFKNPSPETLNFDGDFDLPMGAQASLYHQLDQEFALLFDLAWTDWSDFGQIPTTIGPINLTQERNWKDTWRVGAGVEWDLQDNPWLLRTGISYDSSPVDDEDRLPDIPVGEAWRFSGGASYSFSETMVLSGSYTLMYLGEGNYDNVSLPPSRSVVLAGDTENNFAHVLNISMNWAL